MKPILKFPKIIILSILLSLLPSNFSQGEEDYVAAEYYDPEEGVWPLPESARSPRAMYLAQGVEFVFPIGVQYTLANVNEQLWPIGTAGFEGVLEFPKNKIAIMFSNMVNTLKLANFSVSSTIYTPQEKELTTPLRILGTEIKTADFKGGYKDSWTKMNAQIYAATGGAIPEFFPRGGLYGRSVYPFTTAAFVNTMHYQNQWAFPWKDSSPDKFTDSPQVPYMEVEGLMPFYENEAFVAVAALFKSGTGSVVFLKPKGAVTILQLMLNPTALTQIFDENFPGWGVKQMRVRVPAATFTTNSQHFDMLVKRGVTNSFCVHEIPAGEGSDRNSLNPIVQTNHIQIGKDSFSIASVTGVTLNNEKALNDWNSRQRDDDPMAPETLLEEYTTPKAEEEGTTIVPSGDYADAEGVVLDDEAATTTDQSAAIEGRSDARSDLASISLSSEKSEDKESVKETENDEEIVKDSVTEVKGEKKQAELDFYDFNEPFLWFLHAINEEPMFMGVVESFKRYMEETGNNDNVLKGTEESSAASGVIEKNGWIYEAARGVLFHCPSMINRQAE